MNKYGNKSKATSNLNDDGNSFLIPIVIVVFCLIVLIGGKLDVLKTDAGNLNPITRLRKGEVKGGNLPNDFKYFAREISKRNVFTVNKDIKGKMVPRKAELEKKLIDLRAEEANLNHSINNIPVDDFVHDKMNLATFIVQELKNSDLIYEIDYNYVDGNFETEEELEKMEADGELVEEEFTEDLDEDVEEDADGEEITAVEESTNSNLRKFYGDTFAIRVYDVDKGNNFEKLNRVLDNICVREPYQISQIKMKDNDVTKSYYFQIVIEV